MENIPIRTEFIRLDAALKLSGLVDTGGQAKASSKGGACRSTGSPAPCGEKSCARGTVFPGGPGIPGDPGGVRLVFPGKERGKGRGGWL